MKMKKVQFTVFNSNKIYFYILFYFHFGLKVRV